MKILSPIPVTALPWRCFSGQTIRRTAVLGLLLLVLPLAANAQVFVPPDRGMPARREGGGTRGCWEIDPNATNAPNLVALAPAQNFGYTLDGYPSFFVYVPASFAEHAVAAEFLLQDADENPVYQTTYQVSDRAGILRIDLPRQANLPPLTVGQDYHWSFTLVCNPEDPSANLVVDSWIQRIAPSAQLQDALAAADPTEHPDLMASQGIWYDTIAQLADLAPLDDRALLLQRWQTLLQSVDLTALSDQLNTTDLAPLSPEASDLSDTRN